MIITIIGYVLNGAIYVECALYKFFVNLDFFTNIYFNISIINIYNIVSTNLLNIYNIIDNSWIYGYVKYIDSYVSVDTSKADFSNNILITHFKLHLAIIYFSYLYFILLILLIINYIITQVYVNVISYIINFFSNESENNLSNYFDIKNIMILFICFLMIFVLNVYISDSLFKYLTSIYFSFFLNIITLLIYLSNFSVNSFVYIKGLYSKFKSSIFFIDSISINIFATRLILQLLRLLICISIFYLLNEMSYFLLNIFSELDRSNSLSFDFFSDNIKTSIGSSIKTIIEYLDMFINSSTQFSIYIISIMWLIPYLFSFVKKIIKKIYNNNKK